MERRKELLIRVYFVLLVFVALTAVILWRVVNISLVEGEKWREKGGKYVKWVPVEAERGNIYSDDGSLLATSIQFFEIRMDPAAPSEKQFNKHIDSLSYYLSRYSDMKLSKVQWKDLLVSKRRGWNTRKEKGSRNVLIASKVNYDLYRRFKKFPLFKLGTYQGGLIANKYSQREKPFKELASRLVGEDRENAEKVGLERYYDEELKGETVQRLMKRIPPGVWIPLYDPTEVENKKGNDVVTTIDVVMQDIVYDELKRNLEYQNATAGTAIVMEVSTGAIKAMANLSKTESGSYREVYNHAVLHKAEPGSTFKLATVLALLEDEFCSLESSVDLQGGKKKFYDQWMHDSDHHNLGVVSMYDAFVKSSNVGIASLAMKHYGKPEMWSSFTDRLRTFGVADKTGIRLDGEPDPLFKDPRIDRKRWYGTTVPWMAHGYELMMTPLQVLNLYNAVANDGNLMRPYLVREILENGVAVQQFRPEILRKQIASPETIKYAKEMLEGVVLEGTAKKLKSDKYAFAGKTGTSSVNYNEKNRTRKKYNASFAGYFPAKVPKYSVYVVVYEPRKGYYGGSVAGPVFRAIADRCISVKKEMLNQLNDDENGKGMVALPGSRKGFGQDFKKLFDYLGLSYRAETQSRWVEMAPEYEQMKIEKMHFEKELIPDVRGMGARDAMYVLENMGLEAKLHGAGKITRQSILPGTKIKGQTLDLYLN